jgi:DNA-binding NtrC family response regulator
MECGDVVTGLTAGEAGECAIAAPKLPHSIFLDLSTVLRDMVRRTETFRPLKSLLVTVRSGTPSILIVTASGTPALTDVRMLPTGARVSCCRYAGAGEGARRAVAVVILEVERGEGDAALELLRSLRGAAVHVVLIVRDSSEQMAIAALNAGATRYLTSRSSEREFREAIDAAMPGETTVVARAPECLQAERFVGESAPIRQLRADIARVARCQSNVLITGETGTGKELVAELLHENSMRRNEAFVCLNSTAIPDALIESELFGYERGAFTGAAGSSIGKLAAGNRGTVFFDEIGDISAPLQAKLLRALDHKLVYRLGGSKPVALDIRVLAATNQNLLRAIEAHQFRSDLYYRLNVVHLEVPPLRRRPDDIALLVRHYVAAYNHSFGTRVDGFSEDALHRLVVHDWPGNIRELKNVIESAFANLGDPDAETLPLPPQFPRNSSTQPDAERTRIVSALISNNWNKSKAAEQLHWSRMTLYRKLDRLKIMPPRVGMPRSRGNVGN